MTSPLDALGVAFPCPLCGEMTDDPILYWRHKDHPKGKCTETYTGPPEEVAILKQLAEAARGKCVGTIPDTFIACGEDENYCSETCHLRARLVAAEVKLRQERQAHDERCEFWMKRVALAEGRVAELEDAALLARVVDYIRHRPVSDARPLWAAIEQDFRAVKEKAK